MGKYKDHKVVMLIFRASDNTALVAWVLLMLRTSVNELQTETTHTKTDHRPAVHSPGHKTEWQHLQSS